MSGLGILSLAVAAILGSAAQSATGFGVALPVAPVAFALLTPADAVITVATASLMHNLLVLATRHRRLAIRIADAALLIAAALPGLILGALIVSRAPKAPMQLAVGLAILLAVTFRLHEPGRLAALSSRATALPTGLIAGALTTTIGINGPPLVIWLRARHATLAQLRDTLALIFLTLNLAAIPSVAAHGGTIPPPCSPRSPQDSSSATPSASKPTKPPDTRTRPSTRRDPHHRRQRKHPRQRHNMALTPAARLRASTTRVGGSPTRPQDSGGERYYGHPE